MHADVRKAVIASVRLRASQGDCPTEPAHSVETLENVILDLAQPLEGLTSGEGEHDLARPGKIDPCEFCFGVTRHDPDCRAVPAASPKATATASVREALEPFLRWARWAIAPHRAPTSGRTMQEVPGMLGSYPDDHLMIPRLSPDGPPLLLGDFRTLLAAFDGQGDVA